MRDIGWRRKEKKTKEVEAKKNARKMLEAKIRLLSKIKCLIILLP